MNWDELTDDQRRVASSQKRRLLVFGRAGSGKTTVALWCARHFLECSTPRSWYRVLFLTFSRTAVREIYRRSGRALANVRERVEIHTFHSFASRIIKSFGRYAGLGRDLPLLQSDAEAKLVGRDEHLLSYNDLLPLALEIIRTPKIKHLVSSRWPLIICDEFHDTDDIQWELLCELADGGRLVLLADPNQMIYDSFLGHRGVGPRRVEQAREIADLIVDLGIPSHRDPTNVIPAMAEAVRQRRFDHGAVKAAIKQKRLRIHNCVTDERIIDLIRTEITAAREDGARSIGIFGHTNQAVAELSVRLINAGVDHVLVGLPEAHGEALAALETLCLHGYREKDLDEVRFRLAVFLTASVRGRSVPPLALALAGRSPLPNNLLKRIERSSRALQAAADEGVEQLVQIATEVWPRLGITAGRRPWYQAAQRFGAVAHQLYVRSRGRVDEFLLDLSRRVTEMRIETMVDLDLGVGHPIQLMNFHQTKGREADVVILLYRDSDWFGREEEPFPQNSRLLYVSLTRSRYRNVIILPKNPHPLVAPFAELVCC